MIQRFDFRNCRFGGRQVTWVRLSRLSIKLERELDPSGMGVAPPFQSHD